MSLWALCAAAVLSGVAAACALSPPPARTARDVVPGRQEWSDAHGAAGTGGGRRGATGHGGARDPVALLRVPLALSAGVGAAVVVGGWPGVVLGVAAIPVVWRVLGQAEPAAARRRRERLVESLPHAVDLLASCLAVGSSPTTAVELVASVVDAPMCEELDLIAGRLALGVDPVRVWSEVGRHPQLGVLGRSLARAIDSGQSVSDAMHRLAEDLRRTARADVEARARAVGVKAAAPLGLCLLPAFMLTGIVPLVAGSVGVLLGR
jgi:Flp pilus assembly protein TadB